MLRPEDVVFNLSNIVNLTRGSGTNIYAPSEDDPNKKFKRDLFALSFFILDSARVTFSGGPLVCLVQIEAHVFKTISEFPAFDNDQLEYLELANAAAAVVTAVNRYCNLTTQLRGLP